MISRVLPTLSPSRLNVSLLIFRYLNYFDLVLQFICFKWDDTKNMSPVQGWHIFEMFSEKHFYWVSLLRINTPVNWHTCTSFDLGGTLPLLCQVSHCGVCKDSNMSNMFREGISRFSTFLLTVQTLMIKVLRLYFTCRQKTQMCVCVFL